MPGRRFPTASKADPRRPSPGLIALGLVIGTVVAPAEERQVTFAPRGHVLTNTAVWSPDGLWLVYDVREDPEVFAGDRIERVHVLTGEVEVVYRAPNGSACGVVTWHPALPRLVFIQGPETPDENWTYGPSRRRGVLVDLREPEGSALRVRPLDAMDYAPPFTPGALRGGSHVHVHSPDGLAVSFTYEDEVLARPDAKRSTEAEPNQRNIGVSFRSPGPVRVAPDHPRNHDGDWFSVLVSRTVARPRPGTDEISRAFEEGWIGHAGYTRADGGRQRHALAFLGRVTALDGREHDEVFVVDLPEDPASAAVGEPLEGTCLTRPAPPKGTRQRRLTFTDTDPHPGVQGPRHWLRSSPDGEHIAFLRLDARGVAQFWLVAPRGGPARQLTELAEAPGIASAFSWSPDGRALAAVVNGRVCLVDAGDGSVRSLTAPGPAEFAPLPLACVFSPDGGLIAFQRKVPSPEGAGTHAQIFVVSTR